MRPLFLITNDDGYQAGGIKTLIDVAREFGDIVVMAPANNASGLGHSITGNRPLRVRTVSQEEGLAVYACEGTPVDCVKLAQEHFCPRQPDIVLSGINHGSNSSINVFYSGTMGAVIEASMCGSNAIGFSLLNHSERANFTPAIPYVREIIGKVLQTGLPDRVSLNVNIPVPADGIIKGVRVCRQSHARWLDSYEKRIDPVGRPYWWLTGNFECEDKTPDTDQWALENGYVSIVPITTDLTASSAIDWFKEKGFGGKGNGTFQE